MYVRRTSTSAYLDDGSRKAALEGIVIPTELSSTGSTLAIASPALLCGGAAPRLNILSYLHTYFATARSIFSSRNLPQLPAPLFFPSRSGNSTLLGKACLPNPRPRQPCQPARDLTFLESSTCMRLPHPRTIPVCCPTASLLVLSVDD